MRFQLAGPYAAKAAVFFIFWTVIGLSFASQFYIASAKFGQPVSWREAVWWSLGDWYVWAVLSVPVAFLARRFRLEGPSWWRHILLHLGATLAVSLSYVGLRAVLGQWQSGFLNAPADLEQTFRLLLVKTFHFNLLVYWVIVAVVHALDYYAKFRDREIRTAALERRLAEARLRALQMQLNPHFLFNTLHAVSSLMHKDVELAEKVLSRLGDLLRYALESSEEHEVPLSRELAVLDRYLDIEQTRFGARLRVERKIDPAVLNVPVPNLILQPLVENAIRHGIEPLSAGGSILLEAAPESDKICIRVSDNGRGIRNGMVEGVGLSNTRARLRELYGENHQFEIQKGSSGGVTILIKLPLPKEK